MSDSDDFALMMESVADIVLGEQVGPRNKAMSSATEIRWGKHGSVSVKLPAGVFHDHEEDRGGGVLDLLRFYKGMEKREALSWLTDQGFLKPRDQQNGSGGGQQEEKFAGFMEDHPIAIYKYHDEKGNLAYEILKFAKTAQRRFMQRRPHSSGKGWVWGLQELTYGKTRNGDWFKAKDGKKYDATEDIPEAKWFLYNRAEVVKAVAEGRPVILVEGEKDVETVRAWGLTATTNQGGAKNWAPELDDDLKGAIIVLCSDLDKAGNSRTLMRGAALRDVAKTVRVLDLALHWNDHPEKADVTDWKEKAGGTAEAFEVMVKRAPLWKPEAPKSGFGAFTWDDMDAPGLEYEYLIDGLLTERGRSVFGGPSGSGKSFLAIHAAMCISRGQDFFQFPVKRAGVIYQAGEGGHGIKKRFRAYRKHFEVSQDEDIPLVVLPAKVDLFSKEGDTKKLIEEIRAWELTLTVPLGILFIDTLATATIGADENSGKDMSVVLANIAEIESACKIHVCLVHHMNADGKKLRGHTSIHANVDQVVLVTQDEDTRVRTAKLAKQKDDEDGLKINFKLASVPLGENLKTGRTMTSCVVVSMTEAEMLKKEEQRLGYSPNMTERNILTRIFKAQGRYGVFNPGDRSELPTASKGRDVIRMSDYLEVSLEMMPEIEDKGKAKDQIRKEFTRGKENLIKYGIIGVVAPHIWFERKPVRGFRETFPNAPIDSFEEKPSPGLLEALESEEEVQL